MNEIVDTQDLGNLCRLCLSTKEPRSSVFGDQASGTVTLLTKIQTCLSIEILTSDKVSTSICSKCLRRISKWHAYKQYCLCSQEKLQKCLDGRSNDVRSIKVEPMDLQEATSEFETVASSSSNDESVIPDESMVKNRDDKAVTNCAKAIKREAADNQVEGGHEEEEEEDDDEDDDDDDDDDGGNAIEIESVGSTELLLNPMALGGEKVDRLMEADSTQKSSNVVSSARAGIKKKVRRGPQTHYRGLRRYKQRCSYCQIYLHSKFSYSKHMERFHSGKIYVRKARVVKPSTIVIEDEKDNLEEEEEEEEAAAGAGASQEMIVDAEMIEDVEDELISLEKDAPLTPVQQNIISQLKTFSCYTCRLCFGDRRSTLNHIRQHMPDLRPYTCIACLTEFADRSIYKLHCGASFQCAMKIALVVPKHGTEKYFTCNMCLRSLADRKELLSHLSRHSDKQYEQLITAPFSSPSWLKPQLSAITSASVQQNRSKNRISMKNNRNGKIPAPYDNGNPAHNHECVHCGMIYKYKQNMTKHVSLCKKLPYESRICYRCVNCGMTFLAFNKFHTHVSVEHKTNDIFCHRCNLKFKSNDFLSHYRGHYADKILDIVVSSKADAKSAQSGFSCAMCPKSSYPTQCHLTEHRRIHHPKIYACNICDCTFVKASILEAHMAVHVNNDEDDDDCDDGYDNENGINVEANKNRLSIKSDPGGERTRTRTIRRKRRSNSNCSSSSSSSNNTTECNDCGKVFANYKNLRRHIRTVHDAVGRFSCFTCAKTFVREQQWTEHVEKEHKRDAERVENCPQCPEIFESQQELILHRRSVHGLNGEDHLACYICGKSFANETSLKIHRGHHFRVNSRLSIGNGRSESGATTVTIRTDEHERQRAVKSPRARKSFPNSASTIRQLLQCQVCDDRFNDVAILRKHLWDVHCARNKPEKSFISEKLQCELCTNVLPDEESFDSHMKWHESNPILSNGQKREATRAQCDLCGKFYSSAANLRKHKKRHKTASLLVNKVHSGVTINKSSYGFACNVCRKVFAERSTMMKHRAMAHGPAKRQNCPVGPRQTFVKPEVMIKPVRPELDFDALTNREIFSIGANPETAKAIVCCNLCRKILPDARALYKHRQIVHKITNETMDMNFKLDDSVNQVTCTACTKLFSSVANMRIHFTKVHAAAAAANRSVQYRCSIDGCKLTFKTLVAKQKHEKTHANVMYTCALCPRHMLNPAAMAEHMLNAHKTNYSSGYNKMMLCKKIDLDKYVVKGANGRQCPVCRITYPNYKALKVHYLKVHEEA